MSETIKEGTAPALKPCPFCGSTVTGDDKQVPPGLPVAYFWRCAACGARGPERVNPANTREAWNRRADGWISVAERLPGYGQDVQTWSEHEGWRMVTYGSHPAGFPANVTHWQPLPAAPLFNSPEAQP